MIAGGAIGLLIWAVAVRRASRTLSRWRLAAFGLALLLLVGGVVGAETIADPTSNHAIRTYDWRYLGIATVGFLAVASVLAAAAMSNRPTGRQKPGVLEWSVILLLPVGGIAFGLGWCLLMLLLWTSRAWDRHEKLIATLALPGGPIVAFLMYDGVASSGWPDVLRLPVLVLIVASAFLPTAAAILLARSLRSGAAACARRPHSGTGLLPVN
jgi:hypothetical protein